MSVLYNKNPCDLRVYASSLISSFWDHETVTRGSNCINNFMEAIMEFFWLTMGREGKKYFYRICTRRDLYWKWICIFQKKQIAGFYLFYFSFKFRLISQYQTDAPDVWKHYELEGKTEGYGVWLLLTWMCILFNETGTFWVLAWLDYKGLDFLQYKLCLKKMLNYNQ